MTTHNIDYVWPHHTQNSFRYLRCWGGLSEAPVFASFSRMNEPWPWWWHDDMMTWLLINKLRLVIFYWVLLNVSSRETRCSLFGGVRTVSFFYLPSWLSGAPWGHIARHIASFYDIANWSYMKRFGALWRPREPWWERKKIDGAYFLGGRQTMPLMSSSIKGAMNFYNSMKRRSVWSCKRQYQSW